ncbi:MAG TPA: hypothetical protein VGA17_06270 [Nitrospiraceae bacterium]|jgi:hypothetical protein
MTRRWPALAIRLMAAALFCLADNLPPGFAETRLLPGIQAEADEQTVKELLAVFERADKAVRNRDLEGVMAVYSKQYNYHGLKKSDIRKVWMDLFDSYEDIDSTHLFSRISRIVSVGPGDNVEITCSGSVHAVSKISRLRVPIDSWYGEVHYMVKEDGTWKIRGNLGDIQTVLPFGTAPHPLF